MPERTAVIVDSEKVWLDAIEGVLTGMQVKVVGKTTSLADAIVLVGKSRPDLVVVDIGTNESRATGLSWISQVRASHSDLKVIALSSENDQASIGAVFASGAHAYILKRQDPNDVAVAVRQVYERSFHLATDTREPRGEPSSLDRSGLTRRELDILRLAAEGLSNVQIAKQLYVTEQTVKFHLSNIYRKLDVTNRTQAARQAHRLNLLSAGEPRPRRAGDR